MSVIFATVTGVGDVSMPICPSHPAISFVAFTRSPLSVGTLKRHSRLSPLAGSFLMPSPSVSV